MILGHKVRVLTGEEDAQFSALGIVSGYFDPDGIVGDLGGGSLELIDLKGAVLGRGTTTPLGGIRLSEYSGGSLSKATAYARKLVREVDFLKTGAGRTFYAVGGTWRALARIHLKLQDHLYLGNLDAMRDWGHARDYVEMQWLMLQQEEAEDYVIATGVQHSVRDFVNLAAAEIGLALEWNGSGADEKGYDAGTGKCLVSIDPRYFRPTEVATLLGDPSKAKQQLGWEPRTTFEELVREMMREDLESAKRDELIKQHGFRYFVRHE